MNGAEPRKRPRSRALGCLKLAAIVLFLLPAALGIPAVLAYNWVDHQLHQPANPANAKVRFVVAPGSSFHEVADTLHRVGLIDSVTVFDDSGWEHDAVIDSLSAAQGELKILRSYETGRESTLPITLAVGT